MTSSTGLRDGWRRIVVFVERHAGAGCRRQDITWRDAASPDQRVVCIACTCGQSLRARMSRATSVAIRGRLRVSDYSDMGGHSMPGIPTADMPQLHFWVGVQG